MWRAAATWKSMTSGESAGFCTLSTHGTPEGAETRTLGAGTRGPRAGDVARCGGLEIDDVRGVRWVLHLEHVCHTRGVGDPDVEVALAVQWPQAATDTPDLSQDAFDVTGVEGRHRRGKRVQLIGCHLSIVPT